MPDSDPRSTGELIQESHRHSSPANVSTRSAAGPQADDALLSMRDQISTLREELAAVRADLETTTSQLRRDVDELNRQLGN
jgi:hypothetical protein